MNILKFKILIGNQWVDIDPIFNDFQIKKQRDKDQIFVFRTICDSEITLVEEDFGLLAGYAGQSLSGTLTETIGENSYTYPVIYSIDRTINYDFHNIKAKVKITDKYFYFDIFKSKDYNFQYYTSITFPLDENYGLIGRINKLSDILQQLINLYEGDLPCEYWTKTDENPIFSLCADLNCDELYIARSIYKHLYSEQPNTDFSIEKIINFLLIFVRAGYFLYEYEYYGEKKIILDFSILDFSKYAQNWLTIYTSKQKFYKKYEVLTEKNNTIETFKTIEYNEELSTISEFCDKTLYFNSDIMEKTASYSSELETCVQLANFNENKNIQKPVLMAMKQLGEYDLLNTKNFDNQIYNIDFPYISGTIELFNVSSGINNRCYFWKDGKLNISSKPIDLRIEYEVPPIAGYNPAANQCVYLIINNTYYKLYPGVNAFNVDNYNSFYPCVFYSNIGFSNKQFKFYIRFRKQGFYYPKEKNTPLSIENVLKNNGFEFGGKNAKMSTPNSSVQPETIELEKANNKIRIIEGVEYFDTIASIPDFACVTIDQQQERVESVTRRYSNFHYSFLTLEISKK